MRRAALLLAAALAASCSAAAPEPSGPPDVPLPAAWSAPAGGNGPADAWRSFGDARLEALVLEALERNRDLAAAAAAVDAAAAQARIDGADLWPEARLGLSAVRARRNFLGFPLPGGGILSTTSSQLGVSLDTGWELDLWGRAASRASAALAELQATEHDLEAARLSIAGQTVKAYLAAVEARRQAELADAVVESNRMTASRIRERTRLGLRPALDLRLAEENLASSEAAAAARRELVDGARRQLELLLGRYPAAAVETAAALPNVPPAPPAGLPAELLARRPDLAAAERRLAAFGARLSEAEASLLPRLSLTGSGGTATEELRDLVDLDFRVWSLAANLLTPLFEGGRLEAAVDLAEARRRQALARYAQAALVAFSEVEVALAAEQTLARREEALGRAAAEARAAYDISRGRYLGGLLDIVTLLEVQRRLTAAESQQVSVRRARLEARVNLHLALGGDF
jgi:NodT family efflux transporter outer membrane factor (OMF) lipoprotein